MLAYAFVVLAIAVRFMPHPWMFTPLTASLLYFGARGPRRFLWAPIVMLAASDVVLTKYFWHYRFTWDQLVIWAWYVAVLMLGTKLRENKKPLWIMASALGSSVAFYLVSNFAVWAFLQHVSQDPHRPDDLLHRGDPVLQAVVAW